jgi:hypothetical protein
VDAKLWQIAKAGIVWEVELEKVETVEPPLSKMLKAMEAAPLETQLMDQWKEEQVAELMGAASLETQLMNLQGAPLWDRVGALEAPLWDRVGALEDEQRRH